MIESKDSNFQVGAHVWGQLGWATHSIFNVQKMKEDAAKNPLEPNVTPYVLPVFDSLPLSLGLGILGMPGNTAYFGFLEICQPKSGETVVVTGAAGAVGSAVGQIAKIKGCTVIGLAGSEEKCRWLREELGFDHAINYKSADYRLLLTKAAPKGIDCYFDNVGGEISSVIMQLMNKYGRVSVCGAISAYNDFNESPNLPKGKIKGLYLDSGQCFLLIIKFIYFFLMQIATVVQPSIVWNQLKIEGFIVYRWAQRWNEGITQLKQWIDSGKLKYHETITNGFENIPQAFIDMLNGVNTGKAIVKV